MIISDEKANILIAYFREACLEVIEDAHAFIGKHELKNNPFSVNQYPSLATDIYYDTQYYSSEWVNSIPFLRYRIPKYYMGTLPDDKKYYSAIFAFYRQDPIDLENYAIINEIINWINSDEELIKVFTTATRVEGHIIRNLVREIVERYLYVTNAEAHIPNNLENVISPFVSEKLLFYLEEKLSFDICVPICLGTFKKELIFDEGTKIISIPDELQISRQVACQYEVIGEDWVAACATHMIVLHNYCITNANPYSFYAILKDYSCFPVDRINEIIGIIRVATGYNIGYEQILLVPKGWVSKTWCDLETIYGVKTHFVNPKYIEKHWEDLPVSEVTEDQCDDIVDLYKNYIINEKKLRFSLMRLNRCMLRDEVDDMTTDACIGLESLLSGSTHSEITNTIASRIPFVLSKMKDAEYAYTDGRKIMKKIYNLRSKIVHGGELKDKDIYAGDDENKIYLPEAAVDYLRIVLAFMTKNPEYLEPSKIDDAVDSVIANL